MFFCRAAAPHLRHSVSRQSRWTQSPLSRAFQRAGSLHSTSTSRVPEAASQLSLDFAPSERVRKYLSELNALLTHRSTMATSQLVNLLIYLHDTGLQVPLEYFRCALDICAFRRDASAVSLLLGLARKNINVYPHAGAALDPLDELHKFALTKLTKHGSLSDTLMLWKEGGAEQRFLEDAPVLRAVLSKAAGRHHQADVHVMELLQQRVGAGSWDQSPQYFATLLGSLRDRFRALGGAGAGRGPADLVAERARLDATLSRAAACLPQSASSEEGGAANGCLDAYAASVISALKVQCLVALATAHRAASSHETARALLAEAKAESGAMLVLDAELAGRGVSTKCAEVVDSGDVAAGAPRDASGDTRTGTEHATDLQKCLLGILEEQRHEYSGQSGGAEPLSHVMRSSLLRRSRLAGDDGHEGGRVFDGVDVGAEYRSLNNEEHSRRALLDLLRECSHSLQDRYPQVALALVQDFLAAHHPQRRSVGREVRSTPLNRVLSPCYDVAMVPADEDFAMTRLASTAHPNFGSLTPRAPLSRHAPIPRASEDTFLEHLVCQTLYNCVHMHDGDMLSEQAGCPAYKKIASFARRLHALSLKYGIECGAHFHARWILALPLLATPRMAPEHEHEAQLTEGTEERAARMCWRTSLSYCMRVRASYVESVGGDGAVSDHQQALLTHAVVSHLCGYRCEEAFHYATHLVHEQVTRSCHRVLSLTWNTLLTTATVMRQHQDIIFIMNELGRRCAGADLPLSAAERRLQDMVSAQDTIEDSFFADCIYAKPAAGAAMPRDPNLLAVLLRAQLALNNGYEALSLMKQLRHCGVVVGRADYAWMLRALGTFRGAALESRKSPLQLFASVRVDVTSDYLLQEMRQDCVELDSGLICGLVGLYAYPAQWHRSNVEVMDSCSSIEAGGVSASRQAVQQAMQMLDDSCRASGLAVDHDMLLALIKVCCAGRHDDLAMDILSSAAAACDREPEEDGHDGPLAFRVPLSAVLFGPVLSLHCRRLQGLGRAEGLLQSMGERGIAPSGDMLGEVVALLLREDELRAAVTQISRLHELTGVLPARQTVLALLDSLLEAKNRGDGRASRGGGEDDVQRLLNVVGSLYSGEGHGDSQSPGGDQEDECIYYEDLEPLFRQHHEDLEAYDI